jgi:plasmid replication initiation protein
MANLVKYHNDINKIPLRNFNEKELNIFFSILFKMKDLKVDTVKFQFSELKKLSANGREDKRLIIALNNIFDKLINLNQKIILQNNEIIRFNLFRTLKINPIEKVVTISINEDFQYMLNEFIGNYTKFELEQLVSFKSSYSKNIFRLLKQFESSNVFSIYLDEFRRILCVPESYEMRDFNKRVLKPAMEELSTIFPDLKLEKIKERRKIKTLKFTWNNYCSLEDIEDQPVIEIKISEQLNKIIEKTKKNRFIRSLLTVSNIEKLIKKYSEDLLIKGLNFATQEINYEIKSLSYLEKTIDTGIENSRKKIIVGASLVGVQSTTSSSEKKENAGVNPGDYPEDQNTDFKASINPVDELKGEVAKWCMKNKKYPLFGELEDISSLRELGKFLEKYNIEI